RWEELQMKPTDLSETRQYRVSTSHQSLLRRFALLLALLALGTLAWPQTDLTGLWVFRVPTGDGNFRETFFELKQNGETIAGKVLAGSREAAITEGTFKNEALEFAVVYGNPPQTRRVVYQGTLHREKIALTSQAPGRDPLT